MDQKNSVNFISKQRNHERMNDQKIQEKGFEYLSNHFHAFQNYFFCPMCGLCYESYMCVGQLQITTLP